MKFDLIMRHRRLLVLLTCGLLAALYWLWHANWLSLQIVRQPTLLQRLHVPQPSDPWEIDAIFDGYRVKIALPEGIEEIDKLPPLIQKAVRKRIEFRNRNILVLRKVALALDQKLKNSTLVHIAGYDQTLAHVVMSLPPMDGSIPVSPLALHEPILAALPDYSEVVFFLPDSLIPQVASRLHVLQMGHRVRLHGVREYQFNEEGIPIRHATTRWTRDLFRITADQDNKTILWLPLAFYQINDLSRPDNNYVRELDDGLHDVVSVPLFLKVET